MPAIPEELAYLLRTNVLAHVSLAASDGSLVTHVMWVDYDGEHILTREIFVITPDRVRAFMGRR